MKTFLLLAFAAVSVAAEPPPPSADQVTEWAAFSKPIHLKVKEIGHGNLPPWGDAIWMVTCEAKKETFSSYVIGLFKAGNLFGKDRAKTETGIREQVKKFAELEKQDPGTDVSKMRKYLQIEVRPDGRKVYFSVLAFGPGGSLFGAFTTVGRYDLLLAESVAYEDHTPPDQRLKDPAKPTKELSDIFRQLEQHITNAK
ncbi:MAG: hypothetical protein A2107_11475 [Verrucomicrobia bacterium GWF2_62_7]|nr:MAG: hypothetical protein A2107_11475 [Verrucomicrobia bacterium GWF2_62_7]